MKGSFAALTSTSGLAMAERVVDVTQWNPPGVLPGNPVLVRTGGDHLGLPPSGPSTGPKHTPAEPKAKLLSSLAAPDTRPGEVPRVSILAAAGDKLKMVASFAAPDTRPGNMPKVSILALIGCAPAAAATSDV